MALLGFDTGVLDRGKLQFIEEVAIHVDQKKMKCRRYTWMADPGGYLVRRKRRQVHQVYQDEGQNHDPPFSHHPLTHVVHSAT